VIADVRLVGDQVESIAAVMVVPTKVAAVEYELRRG